MLHSPRRCPYCEGAGKAVISSGSVSTSFWCYDCNGSGKVCNLCSKPDGQCECPREPEECERCGKMTVACKCC